MQKSINPPVCSHISEAWPPAVSSNMLLASCLFCVLFFVSLSFCPITATGWVGGELDCVSVIEELYVGRELMCRL